MQRSSCLRWLVTSLVLACLLPAKVPPAAAQRALPDAAPLGNFNPLCESSLVPCLRIDPFAGHAYGQIQVLPKTDLRDTAVLFPLGVTLGLLGRVAGGISTYYALWREGESLYQQLGPVRLHLTGRLLPLRPLASLGSEPHTGENGASHDAPSRGFQLGFVYEHEIRVGPFSGANSLGFLWNLASLHVVGSKRLGLFELSASLGALFDWGSAFATGTASGQLALFIPGFQALKIFIQGMGRGFPAYVKKELGLPLLPDGQVPIHPQGMVGGGLAFAPHDRVDLSVEVQRGFGGGIAPWVVGISFLVVSGGKKYDGRAVTPIPQLAADATVEAVRTLNAYIESLPIDPVLDARCMLLDDNGEPLVKEPVGTRSAGGKHCIVQGEKLPIGENWWRDRKKSLVCRDSKLSDCLMYRRPNNHRYHVLHRPWVGEDCVLRENVYDGPSPESGQLPRTVQLAVLGTQTPDRKGCTDQAGYVHPVGTQYYREEGHQWICAAPRIEEQRDRCFLALAELPQKMQNQVTPLGRISRALDQGMSRKVESIDKLPEQAVQTAEDVAEGKITLTTIKGSLRAKAHYLAAHATLGEAKRWVRGEVEEIKKWNGKSAIEQGEDVARGAGDAMIPHPVTVTATVVTGGIGRGILRVGEELGEAVKVGKQLRAAGKQAAHAEKAAQHAEHAAAGAIKEAQRSISSLEKRIAEHEKKLAEFKANPTVRPGMENMPKAAIEKQQQARIHHLEHEIKVFHENIEKVRRGEL